MAQNIDPDVQATLSDFLTFTEHFPATLTRALTLIQSETLRAEKKIAAIHADTTRYSLLPSLPASEQQDPAQLRKDISYALEEAERAGRMRYEEAVRLRDTARKEQARLDTLVQKLKAVPLPSRDPTPEDDGALTSPNLDRKARFGDVAGDKILRRSHDKAATKLRARKIIVPGEVLPPPDPNAPPETFSDWSSSESEAPEEPVLARKHVTPRPRSRTPKLFKLDRYDREERDRKANRSRGPRIPGQPGTNAHSAIAGISTSNALLALHPPPPDAAPGSKWLPWMKLTEWEMAKLRKRMKKNAIWVPSATMVRRELKNLGRGVSFREAARAVAEAAGKQLVDEHSEPDPTKLSLVPGSESETVVMAAPLVTADDDDADAELINRGMRLNEAKKLKRARMLEEQKEAAAQLAREQAGDNAEDAPAPAESSSNKRKREPSPEPQQEKHSSEQAKAGPPLRKLKLTYNAPQAQAGAEALLDRSAENARASRSTEQQKTASPPPPANNQRKPILVLKANKAVSEEPPNRRMSLRRSSNVSLPGSGVDVPGQALKMPARRSKRPAPGVITGGDDDSARVSASRRKAAPRKRGSGPHAKIAAPDPQVEEESIDPNEPRYCVCGDVSWGVMIQCENEANCEKEWFHLSCVGLDDLPPRRTKWYCPDCRKKLKLGQSTNGLVGRVGSAGR